MVFKFPVFFVALLSAEAVTIGATAGNTRGYENTAIATPGGAFSSVSSPDGVGLVKAVATPTYAYTVVPAGAGTSHSAAEFSNTGPVKAAATATFIPYQGPVFAKFIAAPVTATANSIVGNANRHPVITILKPFEGLAAFAASHYSGPVAAYAIAPEAVYTKSVVKTDTEGVTNYAGPAAVLPSSSSRGIKAVATSFAHIPSTSPLYGGPQNYYAYTH